MICDNLIHFTGGANPFSRRTLLTSESLIQIQAAFAGNGRGEDCEQVRAIRVAEQRERQQGVEARRRASREAVTVLLPSHHQERRRARTERVRKSVP